MAERNYDDGDPNNPYGTGYGAGQAPPSGDPWTPDELAQSQQWANQYYSSHQIPTSWGTPDDIANSYVQFRRSGMSHADAMAKLETVPTQLGWDKYKAPGPDAPKPPVVDPGNGDGGGGGPKPPTGLNPYDSGNLVPTDGTYPGGPPPQYGGGPGLNLPDYRNYQPPAYDFQRFTPTTAADLLTDPGYDVRFNRGLDAVRADKAASGVLNGGGTAKALLDYGQDSASQEFKNVDDRRLTDFNVNEGNRFKTYLSNVNTQYDTPYGNAYKGALDAANFAQGNSQFTQNSNYNDWLSSYNAWRNSRNDAFSQKFQVSSF